MSNTINSNLSYGAKFASVIEAGRLFDSRLKEFQAIAANLTDDAQMTAYIGFDGTLTTLQTVLSNAVTAMETASIQNLTQKVIW